MRRLTFGLSLSLAAWAQPAIAPPQIGFALDSAHTLRPVYGIAGSFVVGAPVMGDVVSFAFSGAFGWAKTSDTLAILGGQGQTIFADSAPDGEALFSFTVDGAPNLAYVAEAGTLLQWSGSGFRQLPLKLDGAVVSIGPSSSGEAVFIVQRDDGLWKVEISLDDGAVVSQLALPAATAPALAIADGLVYADSNGIVLQRPDGSEQRIDAALPEAFTLRQMAGNWVQLSDLATGRQFAIRTAKGREQAYELPEESQ